MSDRDDMRELLATVDWAETKWPTRLGQDDIVHTPSGPMVVLEPPRVHPPKREGMTGRVTARVAKYEITTGQRHEHTMQWRPRDELRVVTADRLDLMDSWTHARTKPKRAFLPDRAQAEGKLF